MASIGIVQLRHLDRDNAYRRQLADWYTKGFERYPDRIKLIDVPENCESSRHLFQIIVEDRDGLMEYLNEHEIYPGVHYVDNTRYRMYAYAQGLCPYASFVSDHIISLPMHMKLTYEDVQYVIKTVTEFVNL
jgi:dTDP-4-amino-4,6-dideoxygalactose transaminase